MTGEFDRPDRYGCGGIAMMLFGILAMIAVVLAWLIFNALGFLGTGPPQGGGNNPPGGGNAPPGAVTYRGSDASGDLPLISIRDFTGGNAPITTTGTFTLSQTMPMHPPATFADGTQTDLIYGDLLADYISLGFSNVDGSEGLGLNVQSGAWLATYQGQGCSWEVDVSPVSVSGHISCADVPAYNDADGSTGSVDIELDFSADSTDPAADPSSG